MARSKNRETKENREYEEFLIKVRNALNSNNSRELIWFILDLCGLYDDTHRNDERETNYVNGRRSVGLDIIGLMNEIDTELYPQFLLNKVKQEKMNEG